MQEYVVGFDIGGTKTLALLLAVGPNTAKEPSNISSDISASWVQIVDSLREPRPKSRDETVNQITSMAAKLASENGVEPGAVGVGIAGAISRDGKVLISPNIPELFDFDLATRLHKEFSVPIAVDNDATAAAVAEHRVGSAVGVDHMLYVALGTGIGTSMVLNGEIYRGAHGLAGESGHMVIDRRGEAHITGVRGPWEKYASGSGLGDLARLQASAGRLKSLGATVADKDAIAQLRGEHITEAVLEGNVEAEAVLDLFIKDVAVGLTNLIYVLDPELIVVGGGIANLGSVLQTKLLDVVQTTTLGKEHRPKVDLKVSVLKNKAGAIGAALLAFDKIESDK